MITSPPTSRIQRSTSLRTLAIVAVGACVAAACGGGDSDESADTSPTTEVTTTTVAPTTTAAPAPTTTVAPTTTRVPVSSVLTAEGDVVRQPLTGELLASEDDIETRAALAVKIDNHPRARPNHSGLAVADIVFEELVEGTLTRFAAVFHSRDADPIGPIRSGRSQDIDILSSFNEPLFGWSGGNPGVTELVRSSFLVDIGHPRNGDSYYRGPGSAPHNLYSDSEALYALTPDDHPGAPAQQFDYLGADESFDGEPATEIELEIGSVDIGWTWNPATSSYDRSQEGEPHLDVTYGQLSFENVVVLVVEYRRSTIDSASPEAQMLGEGRAFVFSQGEVIEGRWQRDLAVERAELTDLDGDPIEISVGRTFVELAQAIDSGDPTNPIVDLRFS